MGSLRSTLRRWRAAYHRLVPRQLPNGVIPWRTPILTLAVWVPVGVVLAMATGSVARDVARSPLTVAFVMSLIWVGRTRHWVAAYFVCMIVGALSSSALAGVSDDNLFIFGRMLLGALAGIYAFAAMSRWNAPRLPVPEATVPEATVPERTL